jgi:hypothetical protein
MVTRMERLFTSKEASEVVVTRRVTMNPPSISASIGNRDLQNSLKESAE